MRFPSSEAYRQWVADQSWYQTMELPSGVRTSGSAATQLREPLLRRASIAGGRVLDIGCNSGQYCFLAKTMGAREVIGVDIDAARLDQAQRIAANEQLDVTFENRAFSDIPALGRFDVVLCFAVLTEVQDFFGAVAALREVVGGVALLELEFARGAWLPLDPRAWLRRSTTGLRPSAAMAELVRTRRGIWVLRPTFAAFRAALGPEFRVERLGRGVRYESVRVTRVAAS